MLVGPSTVTRIRYSADYAWTLGEPTRPAGVSVELLADVEPVSRRWAQQAGMGSDALIRLISLDELRGPGPGQIPDRILYAGSTWDVVDVSRYEPMPGDAGSWEAVARRIDPLEDSP